MDRKKLQKWIARGVAFALFIIVLVFNRDQILPVKFPPQFYVYEFPALIQPDGITCGPTSVAMVLQYYGKDVSIEEAKIAANTEWFSYDEQPFGMTSPDYVRHALKELGVSSKILRTDLDHIKYYISQNRPPIILLRSGKNTWHYVVAVGYDEDEIFIADPAYGFIRYMDTEQFMKAWDFTSDTHGSEFGLVDYWKFAIETTDVRGRTLIVPNKSAKEATC